MRMAIPLKTEKSRSHGLGLKSLFVPMEFQEVERSRLWLRPLEAPIFTFWNFL